MDKWLNADRVSGGFMLGFSLLLIFVLIPLGIETGGDEMPVGMNPVFMPRLIGMVMALLSGLILYQGDGGQRPRLFPSQTLYAIFLFLAYIVVVPLLGYLVSTMAFMVSAHLFFGARRWGLILGLSLGLPLVLYGFFSKIMYVLLPTGWLL